jgi:hypothetical protein
LVDFTDDLVRVGAAVALVDVSPFLFALWPLAAGLNRAGRRALMDCRNAVDATILKR